MPTGFLRRRRVRLRGAGKGAPHFSGVRRKRLRWLPPTFTAAALLWLFFLFLSGQLRPAIRAVAVSKATNLISALSAAAVDDTLAQLNMDYSSFVTVEKGADGQIVSLTGNPQVSGSFQRQVVERMVNGLEHLEEDELGIPLGTLTGRLLLSGLGPKVRVSVQAVGDVSANYQSQFSSAGVNQTLHRITLELSVTVYLVIPGEVVPVTAENQIPVAETVIVGQVPDTYLQLEPG